MGRFAGPFSLGTASISGVVTDASTREPVSGAIVRVDSADVAATDSAGAFRIFETKLRLGANLLQIRRVGYTPFDAALWIAQERTELDIGIEMSRVAVELPMVIVEGERTTYLYGTRLREFYGRRQLGLGRYFTRADIERIQPHYVTDLFTRIPGVAVGLTTAGLNDVRIIRGGRWCKPVVFLDGVPLIFLADLDIDHLVLPEDVGGIELYRGPATTPPELTVFNSQCGVIAIWTR